MKRARYYLRRALTDPDWLLQALKTAGRVWLEQGNLGILALLAPGAFSPRLYRNWLQRYPAPAACTVVKLRFSLLLAVEDDALHHVGWAITSVRQQTYRDWELLIAFPSTRSSVSRAELAGMAGNDTRIKLLDTVGRTLAEQWDHLMLHVGGSHVLPMTARFSLHPTLLAHLTEAFADPSRQCVFWDTDRLDNGQRHSPFFRPEWNLTLARAYPAYIDIMALTRTLLTEMKGFSTEAGVACQYDLVLRIAEQLTERQFHRISLVLSHRHEGYPVVEAGTPHQYCLQAHMRRCGIDAQVEPVAGGGMQIRFALPASPPRVAIIMPTRDGGLYLHKAVTSVLSKTRYPDFTLYIIDNGSCDPVTLAQLEVYARDPRCQIIRDPRPFNFSALNNHAIAQTGAALVCLLNDDVEVITPEWLADMAAAALQPDIGAVGARLWYPDGCLQHGGVILGYGGGAGHALKFHRRPAASHLDPSALIREFSAVTAACLVAKRAHFDAVGGLDEVNFPVNFNDVDFCLKLRELGYRNLYIPTAELWHHESVSRGPDHIPARRARFANEVATLQARWAAWIANDPAYNPNLSIRREDYSLAWPPRRPVLEKSRR